MQMMTRKKLMPTTLMVLVSMVALGGLLLVNPGNTLLSTGEGAWAASSAPGLALVPARAAAAARSAWSWRPRRRAAGSLGAQPGVGTSAGVGGGAVGAGPGAPARAPPGLQWRPKRLCAVIHPHPLCSQLHSKGGLHEETYRKATRLVPTQLECAMFECWRKRQPWQHRLPTEEPSEENT